MVDMVSMEALSELYDAWSAGKEGVPFSDLEIDRDSFRFLWEQNLIKSPNSLFLELDDEPLTFPSGLVSIMPKGRAIVEEYRSTSSHLEENSDQCAQDKSQPNDLNEQQSLDKGKHHRQVCLISWIATVIGTILATIIATRILAHWDSITSFISGLFH